MKKTPPSIFLMRRPKLTQYQQFNKKSRNISKNNLMELEDNYYKDPWFFNHTNLNFQVNRMNIMYKKQKENSNNSLSNEFFLQTDVTMKEKSIPNLKQESINKEKRDNLLLYQNIFKTKSLWKNKKKTLNNLLNLRLAENEKHYNEIAKKENEQLLQKGKPLKKLTKSAYLENQLKEISTKARFMKCVEDYVLPNLLIAKIKIEKDMKQKNKENINRYFSPIQQRNNETINKQNQRKIFLSKSLNINNKFNH